jgi:hypothetical protein
MCERKRVSERQSGGEEKQLDDFSDKTLTYDMKYKYFQILLLWIYYQTHTLYNK